MGGGILYNTQDLRGARPRGPEDLGRVHGQQREDQGGRQGRRSIQTFGDTWTSQLFVLADFYNVQAAVPDFRRRLHRQQGEVRHDAGGDDAASSTSEEVFKAGYLNEDFGAATFDDGLRMVATGEGGALPDADLRHRRRSQQNYPDNLNDVGFFAMPGDDAAKNGLTVWMPAAVYIPPRPPSTPRRRSASSPSSPAPRAATSCTAAIGATGPYLSRAATLPADVPPAVADLLPYFENEGATAPALEFLSPIKGPALEQITVEVGSGIRPAADGAALYDEDVEKQAQQLGLPGW